MSAARKSPEWWLGQCQFCNKTFHVLSSQTRWCSIKCTLLSGVRVKVAYECWPWTRNVNSDGYGVLRFRNLTLKAHRVMWDNINGSIPDGLFTCHRCDNPICCNPNHLFLATSRENTRDAANKGRMARGEDSAKAKLTVDNVRAILLSPETNKALALRYGVGDPIISRIRSRKIWTHVVV